MVSLSVSAAQAQRLQQIKLLVKGFVGFDMRLLVGVVKLSEQRSPVLKLVSDPVATAADVVIIDGKDSQAVAWAKSQENWLSRHPVIWVDYKEATLPGHTRLSRPVRWTDLPAILLRALSDFAASKEKASIELSIPLTPEDTTQPRQYAPASQPSNLAPAPTSVLVVDDSASVRGHLSSVLGGWGYAVTVADSGEAGIKAIGESDYSCVLMDVVMPGIDGYAACHRIKAMPNRASTPIIMLTSKSSPFDKIRGKIAGCDAYLTKPVVKAHLMEVLAQQVKKRQ